MNKPTPTFKRVKSRITPKPSPAAPGIPVPFVIILSLFFVIITLVGIRQIKDTIRFRQAAGNPNPAFEEILFGTLRMEGNPELQITKQQAKQIVPVINPYMGYLDTFSKMESAASVCLDEQQKEFIISKSGEPFNPGVNYQVPPGYSRIDWIYKDIEEYAAATEAPVYDTDGENTGWLNRMPGIEDMVEGIFRLKQAGKLEKTQAAYLAPFLKEMAETYKKIDENKNEDKRKIIMVLTEKQLKFLQGENEPVPPDFLRTYMPDIIRLLEARM